MCCVFSKTLYFNLCLVRHFGELIVNANAYALIMHSFFPVIQGND